MGKKPFLPIAQRSAAQLDRCRQDAPAALLHICADRGLRLSAGVADGDIQPFNL
jgi:hypothetical protein